MTSLSWPQWTYNRHCLSVKDPINVVFAGNVSLQDIKAVLESPRNGWREPRFWDSRTNQYLSDDSQCRKQDKHFMRGHLLDRYHMRLWHFRQNQIGSAHHEIWGSIAAMLKGVLTHYSDSFDESREQVAIAFDGQSGWQVERNVEVLYNSLPWGRSSGCATKISR